MAAERLGGLDGARILLLGAGDMGESMAVALAGAGASEVLQRTTVGWHSELRHQRVLELINELDHTPYKDLGHHLDKLIAYSRMSAADLAAQGRRASFSDVALRPAFRFWRDYFLHGSVFDGRLGVIHAGMSAASVFFKYAFLWERQRRG